MEKISFLDLTMRHWTAARIHRIMRIRHVLESPISQQESTKSSTANNTDNTPADDLGDGCGLIVPPGVQKTENMRAIAQRPYQKSKAESTTTSMFTALTIRDSKQKEVKREEPDFAPWMLTNNPGDGDEDTKLIPDDDTESLPFEYAFIQCIPSHQNRISSLQWTEIRDDSSPPSTLSHYSFGNRRSLAFSPAHRSRPRKPTTRISKPQRKPKALEIQSSPSLDWLDDLWSPPIFDDPVNFAALAAAHGRKSKSRARKAS